MKVNLGPYRSYNPFTDWVYRPLEVLEDKFDYDAVRDIRHIILKYTNYIDAVIRKIRPLRKIKIHIDDYDVWSLDDTLALIILPTLVRLRERAHASGQVDVEDVPANMRRRDIHDRWEWVLDEMIWTFNSIVDDSWEDDYFGPGRSYDHEGYSKQMDRQTQGLILFGKYFRSLWD